MHAGNDFWLNLHRVAQRYDELGLTNQARFAELLRQFEAMPHLGQREVLQELRELAVHLPDLYTVVAGRANALQLARQNGAKTPAAPQGEVA